MPHGWAWIRRAAGFRSPHSSSCSSTAPRPDSTSGKGLWASRDCSELSFWSTELSSTFVAILRSSEVKASACNVGELGSIPGLGRSPGEEMETHSSILAWKVTWTEEPGGLYSTGSKESDTTERLHFTPLPPSWWVQEECSVKKPSELLPSLLGQPPVMVSGQYSHWPGSTIQSSYFRILPPSHELPTHRRAFLASPGEILWSNSAWLSLHQHHEACVPDLTRPAAGLMGLPFFPFLISLIIGLCANKHQASVTKIFMPLLLVTV